MKSSSRTFLCLPLVAALALPHVAALAQRVPAPAGTPAAPVAPARPATPAPAVSRTADYIVAVVNNELVTQVEVEQRIARAKEEAARTGGKLPDDAELRKQVVEVLIDERVMITDARDSGMKVDDAELDRAVDNIASANKMTLTQLRERLRQDGMDFTRFRANLRDQILSDRAREREVNQRVKITDAEVDAYLAQERAARAGRNELNIAQILITIPEGASEQVVAERLARVQQAQARLKTGEPFELVAKAMSEDNNKDRGGEIGARATDRLPDLFVNATRNLAVGAVTPQPVRSPAGFHLLKVLSRTSGDANTVTQTRARHILLRPSAQLSQDQAQRRLADFRAQILSGKRKFEDLAKEYSEDGSASRGGDLGWAASGSFVPEFEITMNALQPGGISQPIVSRFGVHLIQVMERREVPIDPVKAREAARNALREKKFDAAYAEWLDELRAKAFIEMREPPL